MNQCWQIASEDRPTFREIYLAISAFIEQEADYLQLGLNPFAGVFAGGMEECEVEDKGEDGEVEVKDDGEDDLEDGEARKNGGSGENGDGGKEVEKAMLEGKYDVKSWNNEGNPNQLLL